MANTQGAQFLNLSSAADSFVNGGIIVPEFQTEIVDLLRRNDIFGQMIQWVPATGSPSRFFEQTAIGMGAFDNTGAGLATSITPGATAPTRVEKSVTIKAVSNRIDYSLFDLETVAQQGVFAELKAKDLRDMVSGLILTHSQALWGGTDTVSGGQVGSGATNQYVGVLKQITNHATVLKDADIADAIRNAVAQLLNNIDYNLVGKKFALFMNPLAVDKLESQLKNSSTAMRYVQTDAMQLEAGLSVSRLITAAGAIPIIPDPFLKMDDASFAAAPEGQHNFPFALVCLDNVEYHYIGSKTPRVYQLGTLANLNESYVSVLFGAPVVKAPGYSHISGVVQF